MNNGSNMPNWLIAGAVMRRTKQDKQRMQLQILELEAKAEKDPILKEKLEAFKKDLAIQEAKEKAQLKAVLIVCLVVLGIMAVVAIGVTSM